MVRNIGKLFLVYIYKYFRRVRAYSYIIVYDKKYKGNILTYMMINDSYTPSSDKSQKRKNTLELVLSIN